MGIIGLGAIGKRVAGIAEAFGCEVQYYSTSGKNHCADYREVDFDTLLSTSDVISIHAPLTEETRHLMDREAFRRMRNTAVLINVGRGPIIVEQDLREALEQGEIAAAGLDVLDAEPMRPDHALRDLSDSTRLLITPHIAWASVEARTTSDGPDLRTDPGISFRKGSCLTLALYVYLLPRYLRSVYVQYTSFSRLANDRNFYG